MHRSPLAAVLLVTVAGIVPAAELPKVVVWLSDHPCFDTVHAVGNAEINAPNLGRLVCDGFTFTHAFRQGSTVPAVCRRGPATSCRSRPRRPGR
jgi:hypothetical protein